MENEKKIQAWESHETRNFAKNKGKVMEFSFFTNISSYFFWDKRADYVHFNLTHNDTDRPPSCKISYM